MEAAVVFLPLLGAVIAGLFGRQIGDKGAQYVTCALVTLAGVIAWYLFHDVALQGNTRTVDLATWILVGRSEEHTSELQSLMRISYAVFCLKKQKTNYLKKTK